MAYCKASDPLFLLCHKSLHPSIPWDIMPESLPHGGEHGPSVGDTAPRAEEWFLIEWPAGEPGPTKYWLSTLPPRISRRALVNTTKRRWRIERDYQDLKQEPGLGHYEGRGWRGFHHHATLCIAAYGFLIIERAALPPSAGSCPAFLAVPALPEGHRPRGAAAPPGTPCRELHHDTSSPDRARSRQSDPALPVLSAAE